MLPIASYESSSDSESEDDVHGSRSTAMPTLPSFLSSTSSPRDDPIEHRGRVRKQPHMENSWATYVYLEVPVNDEIQRIIDHITHYDNVHPIIDEEEKRLHISLSRCIYLKHHQLEPFVQSIRDHVNSPNMTLAFALISILTNDERTRSFITAEVGAGYDKLIDILGYVDSVMNIFRQPVFYKPPRFHASIAWALKPEPLEKAIGTIPEDFVDDLTEITFTIASMVVKMGNRIVRIPLNKDV
ncbi:hypothetical protein O0I10_005461 [Lichtheimia ornata]|uniref:U6 snRNA phosphodiesterase 1 n=1 Tax=Lichtheimia ornata TaxID=688661 RepID=A0AAD7V483_9FUNG|nr:uncharacterized protein O0I10_005461 [Lichtheimia ornata]KAJ8658737.1 hypothetical protein O0I10_005461 [Lichtheimia ornata]